MDTVEYEPIGTIFTPFEDPDGMPIQPSGDEAARGTVVLEPQYAEGLADLDGFSHCILLYHFHAGEDGASMSVEPFLDETERGLFATRAPRRPNRIGLSVVSVESIDDNELAVGDVDVVDGTPLLDIKPLVSGFDIPSSTDDGWVAESHDDVEAKTADDRFL
ncbi:tRNA (N6-threonylcarbamoyladenosine(37)-N6)-methyltransferase TrmO [Natranaeroarchaeum sulfidigenes]|uniref:tRNA (Thr-GGU) A37 N-methylase n=1 Tax=Natranaeroarchaeum sulfidigenes TaxID=2784880 RepID=A0A897MNX6_9EURY|nr:tRNA (N6-threonylcarbamoyladenosine(37)-N6)-methyltransferase TrmO [Natranaeroarchaeum sulfidigenes]QSG02082.1 tRNA (Thr-GGU) A37 N-methylase [Natranaeroarchaeum sulfidigenes]